MCRKITFLLVILSVGLAGCSSNQDIKNAWKYTSKQYRAYLNTPVNIDMEARGESSDYELALGESVYGMDRQLDGLTRSLENAGRSIGPEWVMTMMRKYPWLSGIALVDGSGNLLTRYPEHFSKPFDATPLLQEDPKQVPGSLRAYVQGADSSPEIYVANPVYVNEELRGLVVAHFDPRALLMYSPDPGQFMIASPEGVIWPGNFSASATPVGQEKWDVTLKEYASGTVGSDSQEFFWFSRYLANLPLVYAMPIHTGKVRDDVAADNSAPEEHKDAQPLDLAGKGLGEGEVGNLGSPNLMPISQKPLTPDETIARETLEE